MRKDSVKPGISKYLTVYLSFEIILIIGLAMMYNFIHNEHICKSGI